LTVGRTHGVHAEPTTFGIKLAGFAFEAARNAQRLTDAFDAVAVGKLSGAVGSYSTTSPDYEQRVLARLRLAREDISTQVVARDRHAALLGAIALAGAGLERLATEIRHLQRTEVLEAAEPFRTGEQKGSSSMPHKRNPITTERISGLARVLRGNASAALENVALWHERDISHSGAERVILPDSTILLDYMQHLAIRVVRGLVVDADRMRANLELTHGALFSQQVLLALVASGLERDEAYRIAQEHAQNAWASGTPLRELLAADPRTSGLDLDAIFDYQTLTRHAHELVARLDEIA
jgi:adenylosuccinate lyase